MASIDELKQKIDLHDLAEKLGIKRGKGGEKANYHSPHHDDKSPSLSIFKGGKAWKDFSGDEGGSCIDLVMYTKGFGEVADAVKFLHELYGFSMDRPVSNEPAKPKSTVEYIADRCLENRLPALEYLTGRGISEAVARRAMEKGSVGFNDWRSPKAPAGEPGHGGPAAAFIVRTLNPGHVVAVDMRYLDPALNGGVKTQTQGEKFGYGWTSDIKRLRAAHTVVVVESPINALSVETAGIPGVGAFAVRGLNVGAIDWRWLAGKRVLVCMDNDEPFPDGHQKAGHRPGPEAAWQLHEMLIGLNISALFVDQSEWEVNDVNDFLKEKGAYELKLALKRVEPWLIPGMPGTGDSKGKPRLYLPGHDFARYWRFRVKDDFTTLITEMKKDDEAGTETPISKDLAGFRVASVSRVSIAGATSVMTGDLDAQPTVMFAVSVQVPRHGPKLIRRVLEDEKLHNIDQWKRFGPVWDQSNFLRMVNILERTAHLGARSAVNFVGLAWRNGELVVNEGPDCYFTEPDKQCPYHNLTFPSGSRQDALKVIGAYQNTFKKNAALLALVWALGGHLKVFLGFWPHMILQARKGAGKSTLVKRLERTIAMTMFSGQSLQTEFRLLTSISHTSHPVGWEELSARKQEIIDKAVGMLQENYQYTLSRRGSDMTEYLLSAPVLLAGEDVPVRSLLGKVVQTVLKDKGPMMPDDLPAFPLRQWLEFLTTLSKTQVMQTYNELLAHCREHSRARNDDGAKRMAGNYAAIVTAWRLLCEFAGADHAMGDFEADVMGVMNEHVSETVADREPWVWILEILLSEISAGNYRHPSAWDTLRVGDADHDVLMVRTSHVMDHIAHTNSLRDKWNALPVKSDRIFKRQIAEADVLARDLDGKPLEFERTIRGRREAHMVGIDMQRLELYGLYAGPSVGEREGYGG
jgi:hypothetical protein